MENCTRCGREYDEGNEEGADGTCNNCFRVEPIPKRRKQYVPKQYVPKQVNPRQWRPQQQRPMNLKNRILSSLKKQGYISMRLNRDVVDLVCKSDYTQKYIKVAIPTKDFSIEIKEKDGKYSLAKRFPLDVLLEDNIFKHCGYAIHDPRLYRVEMEDDPCNVLTLHSEQQVQICYFNIKDRFWLLADGTIPVTENFPEAKQIKHFFSDKWYELRTRLESYLPADKGRADYNTAIRQVTQYTRSAGVDYDKWAGTDDPLVYLMRCFFDYKVSPEKRHDGVCLINYPLIRYNGCVYYVLKKRFCVYEYLCTMDEYIRAIMMDNVTQMDNVKKWFMEVDDNAFPLVSRTTPDIVVYNNGWIYADDPFEFHTGNLDLEKEELFLVLHSFSQDVTPVQAYHEVHALRDNLKAVDRAICTQLFEGRETYDPANAAEVLAYDLFLAIVFGRLHFAGRDLLKSIPIHPFICGDTGTGKSTMARLVKKLIPPNSACTLQRNRDKHILGEISSATKCILVDETEQIGIDKPTLKALMTGETVAQRKAYKNPETVSYSLPMMIVGNTNRLFGNVDDRDNSISRRLFNVSFEQYIPVKDGRLLEAMDSEVAQLSYRSLVALAARKKYFLRLPHEAIYLHTPFAYAKHKYATDVNSVYYFLCHSAAISFEPPPGQLTMEGIPVNALRTLAHDWHPRDSITNMHIRDAAKTGYLYYLLKDNKRTINGLFWSREYRQWKESWDSNYPKFTRMRDDGDEHVHEAMKKYMRNHRCVDGACPLAIDIETDDDDSSDDDSSDDSQTSSE